MSIRKSTLVKLLLLVGLFSWYYVTHHKYTDEVYGCDIKLHMSFMEFNNANVIQALKALKYASKDGYREVCNNVDEMFLNMSCGGFQGGCYYNRPNEIHVSTAHDQFLGWTAAIIVHEACHSKQRNEGRPLSEDECYQRTHETLIDLVEHEHSI